MHDKILHQKLASYLAEVVPANAPTVQRRETGRAFMAGAAAACNAMMAIASADVSDEEEDRRLRAIAAELRQHVDDVQAGRA